GLAAEHELAVLERRQQQGGQAVQRCVAVSCGVHPQPGGRAQHGGLVPGLVEEPGGDDRRTPGPVIRQRLVAAAHPYHGTGQALAHQVLAGVAADFAVVDAGVQLLAGIAQGQADLVAQGPAAFGREDVLAVE
uniref:ABC transporter ATP-binding protein n=1 Tax=Steinernema glaseri TaxID=37863 RepID=A0A1I7Y8H3_9BILA